MATRWQNTSIVAMVCGLLMATLSLAWAGDLAVGSSVEIKPQSLWFEDAERLEAWQELRRDNSTAELDSYEQQILSTREAWQFTSAQQVKVLGFEASKRQVHVEMTAEGRLNGSTWFVDETAVAP